MHSVCKPHDFKRCMMCEVLKVKQFEGGMPCVGLYLCRCLCRGQFMCVYNLWFTVAQGLASCMCLNCVAV